MKFIEHGIVVYDSTGAQVTQEVFDALEARCNRLRAALRTVVNHWREFGPEHAFDEQIERVAALAGAGETKPSYDTLRDEYRRGYMQGISDAATKASPPAPATGNAALSPRVEGLLRAMVENDPDSDAADGVTSFMVWRKEAEDLLAMNAHASEPRMWFDRDRTAAPASAPHRIPEANDRADSDRIDFFARWVANAKLRGFVWDSFTFKTDRDVREQIDEQMRAGMVELTKAAPPPAPATEPPDAPSAYNDWGARAWQAGWLAGHRAAHQPKESL